MEKKKYQKPQICVITIDAVEIMVGSSQTLKRGNEEDLSDEMLDENGYFWSD